jgi:hypothetical protein
MTKEEIKAKRKAYYETHKEEIKTYHKAEHGITVVYPYRSIT